MENINEKTAEQMQTEFANKVAGTVGDIVAEKVKNIQTETEIKSLKEEVAFLKEEVLKKPINLKLPDDVIISKKSNSGLKKEHLQLISKNLNQWTEFKSKDVETKSAINTFNDIQGGYSVKPQTFIGTVNQNRIVYAPILELARKINGSINGLAYIGFDDSLVDTFEAKELTKSQQSDLIKLGRVEIMPVEYSSWIPISNRVYDFTTSNAETYLDNISLYQDRLQARVEKKFNDDMMVKLKKAVTDGTISSYTTKTSLNFTFDDIFNASATTIKPYYIGNATFFTNNTMLAYLKTLKGSDGQYLFRSVWEGSDVGFGYIQGVGTNIKVVGIHPSSSIKFDDFDTVTPANNANKVIGILADFDNLIHCVNYDIEQFRFLENEITNGFVQMYSRKYFGGGIVTKEAGIAIKIKA